MTRPKMVFGHVTNDFCITNPCNDEPRWDSESKPFASEWPFYYSSSYADRRLSRQESRLKLFRGQRYL
jgi:hypothetical protein